MSEELISFETAKLAKEKGFQIKTQKAFIGNNPFVNFEESFTESDYRFDADDFFVNWNIPKWFFDKNGCGCFGCELDNQKWFEAYSRPSQSLLQRWLREKHEIHVHSKIEFVGTDEWEFSYKIKYLPKNKFEVKRRSIEFETIYSFIESPGSYSGTWRTYEQALEQGLQHALNLIKT